MEAGVGFWDAEGVCATGQADGGVSEDGGDLDIAVDFEGAADPLCIGQPGCELSVAFFGSSEKTVPLVVLH